MRAYDLIKEFMIEINIQKKKEHILYKLHASIIHSFLQKVSQWRYHINNVIYHHFYAAEPMCVCVSLFFSLNKCSWQPCSLNACQSSRPTFIKARYFKKPRGKKNDDIYVSNDSSENAYIYSTYLFHVFFFMFARSLARWRTVHYVSYISL